MTNSITYEILMSGLGANEKTKIKDCVPGEIVSKIFFTRYIDPYLNSDHILESDKFQLFIITNKNAHVIDLPTKEIVSLDSTKSHPKEIRGILKGVICTTNGKFFTNDLCDKQHNKKLRFVTCDCDLAHTIKDAVINP